MAPKHFAFGPLAGLVACSSPYTGKIPELASGVVLVEVDAEPPGADCAIGGQRVRAGADINGDGILNDGEVTSTTYVCDSATDPTQLVSTADEPAGINCTRGGVRVASGGDDDDSGTLDPGEIDDVTYFCFTDPGEPPLLTQVTVQGPDTLCLTAWLLHEIGRDFDGSGDLLGGEIETSVRSCNQVPQVQISGPADLPGSGTASFEAVATDPDNHALTYQWALVRGTALTFSAADVASPNLTAPPIGECDQAAEVMVTVADLYGATDVARAVVGVTSAGGCGPVSLGTLNVTGRGGGGSLPTAFNGEIYYYRRDRFPFGRWGLWRTDGSVGGSSLVLDWPNTVTPSYLLTLSGRLYFHRYRSTWMTSDGSSMNAMSLGGSSSLIASRPETWVDLGGNTVTAARAFSSTLGTEPYLADGTAMGTVILQDIYAGNQPSSPRDFAVAGSSVFFSAEEPMNGRELYVTDGTPGGTGLVRDINPGASGSDPEGLTPLGNVVLFTADDGSSDRELWVSDGTFGGTVRLGDFNTSGDGVFFSTRQPTLNGTMYFGACDDSFCCYLYGTDGTVVGTALRLDEAGSAVGVSNILDWRLEGGQLFMEGDGSSLLVTDGTQSGTRQIYALSSRGFVEAAGGELLLIHGAGATEELWRSDGSVLGTTMVVTLQAANAIDLSPRAIATLGGQVYFSLDDPASGEELYTVDGSGLRLVADINPGVRSSSPFDLESVGGALYFVADELTTGRELWRTDGTTMGTVRLEDQDPRKLGSGLGSVADLNGVYIFTPTATAGRGIWRTDGTAGGTTALASAPASLAQGTQTVGSRILFVGEGAAGEALWATDGTPVGTAQVHDVEPDLSDTAVVVGQVFFAGLDSTNGRELWVSDGTPTGTALVADIRAGPSSSGPRFFSAGLGRPFFLASDGMTSEQWWSSDGTAMGTLPLGPGRCTFSGTLPYEYNGRVFLAGWGSGCELWQSDGTPSGTTVLKTSGPTDPSRFEPLSNGLFFWARDSASGFEPWVTDGTDSGTQMLADTRPGTSSSSIGYYRNVGGVLFFEVDDGIAWGLWRTDGSPMNTELLAYVDVDGMVEYGSHLIFGGRSGNGVELWSSDGSVEGTGLLVDINPGTASSNPFEFTQWQTRVYFVADDGTNGEQIWATNGTAAGTQRITNFAAAGSYPHSVSGLHATDDYLFFTFDDGLTGPEPWRL